MDLFFALLGNSFSIREKGDICRRRSSFGEETTSNRYSLTSLSIFLTLDCTIERMSVFVFQLLVEEGDLVEDGTLVPECVRDEYVVGVVREREGVLEVSVEPVLEDAA